MSGHTRLNPYAHLIRRIQESSLATETDRKVILSMAYDFKKQSLTLDQASMVCIGLYSLLQTFDIQAAMEHTKKGSLEHKNLSWCYSKHMDNFHKSMRSIGKGKMPPTRGRKPRKEKAEAPLWHQGDSGNTIQPPFESRTHT